MLHLQPIILSYLQNKSCGCPLGLHCYHPQLPLLNWSPAPFFAPFLSIFSPMKCLAIISSRPLSLSPPIRHRLEFWKLLGLLIITMSETLPAAPLVVCLRLRLDTLDLFTWESQVFIGNDLALFHRCLPSPPFLLVSF